MSRQPRKHELPPRTGRSVLIFIASAAAVVALALGVRAAWPAKAAPFEDRVGDVAATEVDANLDREDDGAGGGQAALVPRPSATPAPKPTPVIAPPGVITKELATTMVTGFVASVAAINPLSTDVANQLSVVARGAILGEIENLDQELRSNGWTLSGRPVVKSVTIVSSDLTSTPATAIVQACIDSSRVATIDAAGKPVGGQAATPPALNLYSLQQDAGGVWRVVARSFPNDPAC